MINPLFPPMAISILVYDKYIDILGRINQMFDIDHSIGVYSDSFGDNFHKILLRRSSDHYFVDVTFAADAFCIRTSKGEEYNIVGPYREFAGIYDKVHEFIVLTEDRIGRPLPDAIWDNFARFKRDRTIETYL